jgi:hypothetical protein
MVGKYHIRFSDNPDIRFIGMVGINTLFGMVYFQVVLVNTLFLFYLNDMNKHRVYFNNVYDVLIHSNNKYLVVYKWGYPWLLINEPEKSIA